MPTPRQNRAVRRLMRRDNLRSKLEVRAAELRQLRKQLAQFEPEPMCADCGSDCICDIAGPACRICGEHAENCFCSREYFNSEMLKSIL